MGPHARQGGLFPVFSRTSLLRRRGWRLVIVFLFGTRQAGGRGRAARVEKKRRETFLRVSSGPGDMRLGVSTGRGFDVFPCCGCKVREVRHPGRCGCPAGAEDGPETFCVAMRNKRGGFLRPAGKGTERRIGQEALSGLEAWGVRTKVVKSPGGGPSGLLQFSMRRPENPADCYSASSKGSPPSRFISMAIFHSRVTTRAPTAKMPRPMETSQKVGV